MSGHIRRHDAYLRPYGSTYGPKSFAMKLKVKLGKENGEDPIAVVTTTMMRKTKMTLMKIKGLDRRRKEEA
ncbi:hypothetical protein CCACVL1_11298 [Corchorus capsularis]|uniref:Uncharacterized protein n=1 Tax=Corchorus capsularis TaxID=210143 RepID=A0A1R3IM81_COCAP|nr:hypothetical protein CCACVL1_11298 [Corchorus capsularis]